MSDIIQFLLIKKKPNKILVTIVALSCIHLKDYKGASARLFLKRLNIK